MTEINTGQPTKDISLLIDALQSNDFNRHLAESLLIHEHFMFDLAIQHNTNDIFDRDLKLQKMEAEYTELLNEMHSYASQLTNLLYNQLNTKK